MDNRIRGIIAIIVVFVIVYTVDSLFFRHLFWQRLIANIIIVIVLLAIFYKLRFIPQSRNNALR